ncbi:diguanylate cyclase [Saccharothrix algeriensis]|uniref:Diguanylate cyclase n=1 Tax=Saccharothrix algeriensis TaxID=173560 RepID=A0A8T8HXN8_9PSEU|nr:diguanylate cyclase [Saccharothrix algeriensis]
MRRPHGGFHVLLGDVTAVRAWWWSPLPDTGRGEVTHLAEQRDFLHRVQSTIDAAAGGVALGLCTLRLRDLGALTRRFGPEARDRVAATAAARITAAVAGMPAAAVGRLDRDTFGVLITDRPGRHGVTEAVRRLVDRVSEPMRVGHRELVLRPAVGVAEVRGGTTAVQLLARAQVALHSAAEPRAGWREVGSRRGAPDAGGGHLLAARPGARGRGGPSSPTRRSAGSATAGSSGSRPAPGGSGPTGAAARPTTWWRWPTTSARPCGGGRGCCAGCWPRRPAGARPWARPRPGSP